MEIQKTITRPHTLANRIVASRWSWLLLLPVSALFLLLFSISTSPLFAFEGGDSAIFQEIGLATTRGKVLYRDIFDNKGPLLYWINGLGMLMGGTSGILTLQIVFQTAALHYLFKIAKLFADGLKAAAVLILSLFCYTVFILEGNQCEEWMLPFISMAIYVCLKFFATKQQLPARDALLLGLCFGACFFIRPNDAAGMVGAPAFGLFLYFLYKHRGKDAWRFAACAATGAAVITVPILTYFAANHALKDLIYGLWGVNMTYTNGVTGMLHGFIADSGIWLIMSLMVCACIVISTTHLKDALWAIIPCAIAETLVFGRALYYHYYISLLPIYTIVFASAFSSRNIKASLLGILLAAFTPVAYNYRILPKKAASLVINQPRILGGDYTYDYGDFLHAKDSEIKQSMQDMERLASLIPASERDSVWNYNLIEFLTCRNYFNYAFFSHNGIVQMNRMTFPLEENFDADPLSLPTTPLWIVADYGNPKTQEDTSFASQYRLAGHMEAFGGRIGLYRRKS